MGGGALRRSREGNECGLPDATVDPQMVEWAGRFTDCFYWVKPLDPAGQADITLLEDVGGCFESLSEALATVCSILEKHQGDKVLERMLPLLAEAQSAVKTALERLGAPDDPDQLEVFEWVKTSAARHRVYLKRFMRADDPADASGVAGTA